MIEKLNEYAEYFGENFPIFIARDLDEGELIRTIDDCIKNNKPYEVETEDDAFY
ncbi:MAG: hypothetical protein IKW21_06085 [Lachnospiraceae bacterium]|nr:hypothetical protein [Lachnospiraceae bacterium]